MAASGLRKLAEKFDEEVKFFKGWIDKPKAVGTFIATGPVTARKMASVIDIGSGLPVLEVGPGTGTITKAILARGVEPENLYAVEYSHDFAVHLRRTYPGVNVIEGDGFELDTALGGNSGLKFDSVVSGVPLLNFPVEKRIAYVEQLLDRIPSGRPVVQITFGPKSPVPPGLGNYEVEKLDFIIRNIPPATLWVYRRGKRH